MSLVKRLMAISLILLFLVGIAPFAFTASKSLDSQGAPVGGGLEPSLSNFGDIKLIGDKYNVSIDASRAVTISPYGVITLNDSLDITNYDSREFNAILIFYERDYFGKLFNIHVFGKSEKGKREKLDLIPYLDLPNYIGFVVKLDRYVEKDSSYSLFISADTQLVPAIDIVQGELYLSFQFPQMINLPYKVSTMEVIFETRDQNARIVEDKISPSTGEKDSETKYKYSFTNIFAFNVSNPGNATIVNFVWKTTTPLMYVEYLQREITFGVSDKMSVKETFYIYVVAPMNESGSINTKWKLDTLTIGLPTDIKGVSARDPFGRVQIRKTASNLIPEKLDAYIITLRTPLMSGGPYRLTVYYSITTKSDYFDSKDGRWNVSLPLAPVINTTILNLRVSVSIPDGYLLKHVNLSDERVEMIRGVDTFLLGLLVYNTFTFSAQNVFPSMNNYLSIEVETSYTPLVAMFIKLFLLVLLFITVIDLILVKYVFAEREEITPEMVEVRTRFKRDLSNFIKYYEEFIAAETDLDNYIREKITVRKSPRVIREDLNRLMREVKSKRDRISLLSERLTADREVYKIVQELLKLEERVSFTRRELISDWSQFLGGKLGKKELTVRARNVFGDLRVYKVSRVRLVNRLKNIYASRYAKM